VTHIYNIWLGLNAVRKFSLQVLILICNPWMIYHSLLISHLTNMFSTTELSPSHHNA